MTRQDIERLARELAKKHRSQSALKVETRAQTYYEYAPLIESVIQDILRDHCIVSKSHLKHVCKMIKEDLKCHESICDAVTISDLAEEQRALIVELFGTDLFKERSEE